MIINTELRDSLDNNGNACKQLVLSYVNDQQQISFLTYNIPSSQMYTWRYARPSDRPDQNIRSWDFKPVTKAPTKHGYLPPQRIHEILLDLIKANPSVEIINKLNIPDTYFCDIEVDVDENGFEKPDTARKMVNTISWVHNDKVIVFGRKYMSEEQIAWIQKKIDEHCSNFKTRYNFTYIFHENEVDLLNDFFYNHVRPAACITGWNFFGFDWPYLMKRCELLGINIDYISPSRSWTTYHSSMRAEKTVVKIPYHKMLYDYMEIYIKWDRAVAVKESNKLDWVSETVVGAKKVVHQLGFKDEWEQRPAEYIFYNAVDSILIREIDQKIKTSSAFFGLANLMHVDALTAFSPVRSLEIVQCEYQYKEGKVFPSGGKKNEISSGYEGAFVYDPIPGIYKNIIALDFASLYPTTMRQFNISPDTFICKDKNHVRKDNEIKCTSGAVYRNDYEGFLPKILTDFYNQRKAYKKEMMIAIDEKYKLEEIYERRFGKQFDGE